MIKEVEKQLGTIPQRIRQYVNASEIVAYAMNRLPPLYATTEEGFQAQQQRARKELGQQIFVTVRRALVAIERNPLRMSTPLQPPTEPDALSALQSLQALLQCEELTWNNLVDVVERSLNRAAQGEIFWQSQFSPLPPQAPDWRQRW